MIDRKMIEIDCPKCFKLRLNGSEEKKNLAKLCLLAFAGATLNIQSVHYLATFV